MGVHLNAVLTITVAQPVCNYSFASISILGHLAGDIPLGNKWFILCSDSITVQFSHLIVLTWMNANTKKKMSICILNIAKMIILCLWSGGFFSPQNVSNIRWVFSIHLMQHSLLGSPQCEHVHSLFRQHTALKETKSEAVFVFSYDEGGWLLSSASISMRAIICGSRCAHWIFIRAHPSPSSED